MSVVRVTRFQVDPAEFDEMFRRRAALISAVRASFPRLPAALAAAPRLPRRCGVRADQGATAEQAEIVERR
jgi:hypothetical protein